MVRLFVFSTLAAFVLILALESPADETTRLLRQPAISVDHLVAFVYAGDIWTVPLDAPEYPRRLTTSDGLEENPHFSPDGDWIAFTGQYESNSDVYVVPSAGGAPERLTWHPGFDRVRGWTRDGKTVLFISGREQPNRGGMPQLWTVPVDGGMPEKLALPVVHDATYSPDGKRLAYVPIIPSFQAWRYYRGGRTTPIWFVNLDDLSIERLPRENSNDHNPMWVGDTIYFLSDREGTMNLYTYDTGAGGVSRLTDHTDFDIKSACAAPDGTIIYQHEGYLKVLGEDEPLPITVRGDFPWARPHIESVERQVQNIELSPKGARALVEARGEIFTLPAEKGDVRNITQSPGVHERDPAWSPDGTQLVYFSDEGGEYHLVIEAQDGLGDSRTVEFVSPSFYYSPRWSPDGSHIFLTDKHLNIWLVEAESGAKTRVDTDTFSNPQPSINPAWAPDSKWIAYSKRLPNQIRAIFLYSLESGETHQITDGLSDAIDPVFDANGKYLYFAASTNAGRKTGWLDMTSYDGDIQRGIYLVVLDDDEPSPLLPESDEEDAESEEENADNGEETGENSAEPEEDSEESAGLDEEEAESEEESEDSDAVEVIIDLEGIEHRILALDVPTREYYGLQAGPENTLFYLENVPNESDATLHKYDIEEREDSTYLTGIDAYTISADRKKLLYAWSNRLAIADTGKDAKKGDGALKTGDLRAHVDPEAEWAQMYLEGWRINRDFFYDEKMHGADWPGVYEKYLPLIKHIQHRSDLAYVLNLMLGETVSGHSRTGGGDYPDTPEDQVGLLGADWEIADGRYRIARIYTGESWNPDLRAPLSAPGIDVRQGDYLLAVNGVPVGATRNLYSYFRGTANRQTAIEVSESPSGEDARRATVVPLANEHGLRNRAWVEDNRRKVDELSGGRLAYVYLPNTSRAGYAYFNRYYFAQQNKAGVILDERYNGGGSVADYMIEVMSRKMLSWWATRDGEPFTSPNAANFGPKVMIINEYAGSGGDFLPYAFRKAGLGPLIGTRTWGGLIGVYHYPPLIDGGVITAPRLAIYSTEGEWVVENEGVAPDVEVEVLPADYAAGRDPQLENAVQVGLRLLDKHAVPDVPRPAPIDRTTWQRQPFEESRATP